MQRQFFSGNSIEQAVLAAARHYKVEPERLAYTVRDKKHGFVNTRKRVVIVVDPESPKLEESQVAAQRAEEATTGEKLAVHAELEAAGNGRSGAKKGRRDEPRRKDSDEDDLDEDDLDEDDLDEDDLEDDFDDAFDDHRRPPKKDRDREERGDRDDRGERENRGGRDRRRRRDDSERRIFRSNGIDWEPEEGESQEMAAFEEAIERVLDVMDLEIEYALVEKNDHFEIDFSGEDGELLTRDNGRPLKALENILPRAVRSLVGDTIPCDVDCDGFQEEHREELADIAREAAERVRGKGRHELLEPMNPADRRIVHMTLTEDPDVETVSEGRGYLKRVKVRPIRE